MISLAIICDLIEENWHSMDLIAEMLHFYLQKNHTAEIESSRLCPAMKRRLTRVPFVARAKFALNSDRLLNRFYSYPAWLGKQKNDFDLYHIIDHSYAQLAHKLPPRKTIVSCHDIDAFRCLLEPESFSRSKPFMLMTERILKGLQRAELVICGSKTTQEDLLRFKIVPREKTSVVYYGAHPSCTPEPNHTVDAFVDKLIGPRRLDRLELLHVGSVIPRKRIDILLRVVASLKKGFPQLHLIRVGGEFNIEQKELVERLGLKDSITVLPELNREAIASVYRRAVLVLQPSEREGFGLPVIEAMACGTPVVASDIEALREAGKDVAVYCQMADVEAWSETVKELLLEQMSEPEKWMMRREAARNYAESFTWSRHANEMFELYRRVNLR